VREGLNKLSDIAPAVQFFFDQFPTVEDELKQTVLGTENAKKVLTKLLAVVSDLPWADQQACKKAVDAIGKEITIKGKDLYWPVRVALTGTNHGPDLGSIISILGEKRVRERLECALGLCSA